MSASEREPRDFQPTRWSLVRRAGAVDSAEAREALEELCRTCWFPLYAFARRRGLDAHAAEDAVQAFFAELLERRDFAELSPERGRFRSFLLAALTHHLSRRREHERALKRGGGLRALSIDVAEADQRLELVARAEDSPERAFERAWARELLQRCIAELSNEYAASGRRAVFEALKRTLEGETYEPNAVAAELGLTPGAVKVAAHRLRQRFGEALRAQIAHTVADPSEVEDELRELVRALR